MRTPLTLSNISELIGKTIIWEAEAYKGNTGYHGTGAYGGIEKANGKNNCLSFSDSYREIFFEIVDEN